jgi:hypothetical protein
MVTVVAKNLPPSARWISYDGWDYNGMKERLESFMSIINKSSLMQHTQLIIGQPVSISEAFSAGQFCAASNSGQLTAALSLHECGSLGIPIVLIAPMSILNCIQLGAKLRQ